MPILTPEQQARAHIDRMLAQAGWAVQAYKRMSLRAARGVAVCEFHLDTGIADYLLFVDHRPIGVIEAKAVGSTLSGVEPQAAQYCAGLSAEFKPRAWHDPLPFRYTSTGVETFFANDLDPHPRSRQVFSFHQPATLARWAEKPPTLRARLRQLPPLNTAGLWKAQVQAIRNLETSLAQDRPRALIQMATGSGKTFTAVSFVYRLIKFASARRVLFMVDRRNLGQQALNEFQQYDTPDDGRKFTELYNVQHLTSNTLDPVSKVCISTVQRLYAMLRQDELDPELETRAMAELEAVFGDRPREVAYTPDFPPEYFDFIIIDECHRSIYNVWRQVLEYFDAYLIGLTATPSKQTFGFFDQNLVMEYPRARAVLDGVNVDGQVYRIRTQITEAGSTVKAGYYIHTRDKLTRDQRWQQLDQDLDYEARQLDRDVVAIDQIRTVVRTFRDRLFSEIYPGRTDVPKTLVFAKDDSHAEDIVRVVREEFGKGDAFCCKITYKVSGKSPDDLIREFRTSYYPRVAVTVDMIATGTDVKPIEVLLFMRQVRSANYFEQMLGRGTRVITPTDLQAVTPDAAHKTHFVIVDAVGVVEHPKVDVGTLDRARSVPFDKLMNKAALGTASEDDLASLAARLARLDRQLSEAEAYTVQAVSGGHSPRDLAHALLDALDPDVVRGLARQQTGVDDPTQAQLTAAQAELVDAACAPFDNPDLREALESARARTEQVIDAVSQDHVLEAGYSATDTERARQTVDAFRDYLETHRDEITALQILLHRPQVRQRLTYEQVKTLAEDIQQPPHAWTTEALWRAYAQLEKDKVRGAGAKRVLTDLVSLVRHAVQMEDELVPYPERVRERYRTWLADQEAAGRVFSEAQRWWLDRIAAAIGVNLSVSAQDFQHGELFQRGGWYAARDLFGEALPGLLDEMNEALV